MGELTISMAMFNSYVTNSQMVYGKMKNDPKHQEEDLDQNRGFHNQGEERKSPKYGYPISDVQIYNSYTGDN